MKFIWRIENFNNLKDGMLQSPSFSSHSKLWEVIIYPTSNFEGNRPNLDVSPCATSFQLTNKTNLFGRHLSNLDVSSSATSIQPTNKPNFSDGGVYISIKLHSLDGNACKLNYSLAFLDSSGSPLIWKDIKVCSSDVYDRNQFPNSFGRIISEVPCTSPITNFIKRSDFDSRKTEFLSNNILTIQCTLWLQCNPNELFDPLSLFARTRIEPRTAVIENTFDWDIINAGSLQPGHISEHVEILTINGEFLTTQLALNNSDNLQVTFKVSMFRCHMKVKISLLDVMEMKRIQFLNDEHRFTEKGSTWTVNTNISKNMIMSHQNLFLYDDTLSLQFICTFSENVTLNRMTGEDEIIFNDTRPITIQGLFGSFHQISKSIECVDEPESKQQNRPEHCNSILQALQDVYKNGFLSDFNLKIGDRVFPVHKVILGARSQVFRAMVTTEMKEKEDNFVDIQDVDEDTLQRLLQFVYSDILDQDLEWESASSLYAAADKYALEPLKQGCSAILKSGLCVSSVLEVMPLADMYQDQELKSAALDFILFNDKEIVGTERWIKFEEENAKLALETCRKLYLKKMNCL